MIGYSRAIILVGQHDFKWSSRLLKQSKRFFGGLDTSPSSVMKNADAQTIYSETLNIPNHGRLEVRCPFNLHVAPLHQNGFPSLDKAFLTIYGIHLIF